MSSQAIRAINTKLHGDSRQASTLWIDYDLILSSLIARKLLSLQFSFAPLTMCLPWAHSNCSNACCSSLVNWHQGWFPCLSCTFTNIDLALSMTGSFLCLRMLVSHAFVCAAAVNMSWLEKTWNSYSKADCTILHIVGWPLPCWRIAMESLWQWRIDLEGAAFSPSNLCRTRINFLMYASREESLMMDPYEVQSSLWLFAWSLPRA